MELIIPSQRNEAIVITVSGHRAQISAETISLQLLRAEANKS